MIASGRASPKTARFFRASSSAGPRHPNGSGSRRSRPGRAGSQLRSRSLAALGPWRRWSRETWRRRRSREKARRVLAWARSPARLPAERRCDPESLGSIACMRRSVGGKSFVSPIRSAQSSRPSFWSQPRRRKGPSHPAGIRKKMVKNQPLEPARRSLSLGRGRKGDLERLDHLAVLNAGGAGRLAGAAIEAKLEVLANARTPSPAGRRRPRASDRSGRAGCRSRRRFRYRSDSSPCKARNGRIPGSGGTESSRRARPGRSAADPTEPFGPRAVRKSIVRCSAIVIDDQRLIVEFLPLGFAVISYPQIARGSWRGVDQGPP